MLPFVPMKRIGICIAGLDGAVASTMTAGVSLIRRGLVGTEGLVSEAFRESHALVGLESLVIAGWDPRREDLHTAVLRNAVVPKDLLKSAARELRALKPWKAPSGAASRRHIQAARDIERFRRQEGLETVIVLNLLPTDAKADSIAYARAAAETGSPFINFTPSECGEESLSAIPTCGRDGKTGQTWLKSVLAPALRSRALRIKGWFSTNLLGNEDGRVVGHPVRGRSKIRSKTRLLGDMLGYEPFHMVQINYYPPRGDDKESWDAIDFEGFLGLPMQLKVNGLWRDSALAAPMCIDLVRFMDLARRRGGRGPQEWLGFFFKSPCRRDPRLPALHDFHLQEMALLEYLASVRPGRR